MSWGAAAWLMLGGSTVLLFLGLPVAFSFLVINLVGAVLFLGGEAGLTQLARNSVGSVASFSLTPIPLFILMGEVLFHTGLAEKVIDGVERLIRQVPGRLAVVGVGRGADGALRLAELDLEQREYRLRAAAYYGDAGTRLRDSGQYDKDNAQYKSDVDGRQKALDAARQEFDEMQEQARKAGIVEKEKDKDDTSDKK